MQRGQVLCNAATEAQVRGGQNPTAGGGETAAVGGTKSNRVAALLWAGKELGRTAGRRRGAPPQARSRLGATGQFSSHAKRRSQQATRQSGLGGRAPSRAGWRAAGVTGRQPGGALAASHWLPCVCPSLSHSSSDTSAPSQ